MAGKLTVGADGRVTGPAKIVYNAPFPTENGSWGSGAMMGAVMHTEVGNEPGTIAWFNNPASQASAHFSVGQDGTIHQYGPIGKGWIAWHAGAGNTAWYGIEHADNGDPSNPLTDAQLTASAQLVQMLSAFAAFPLQVSDSVTVKGYGWHGMGGAAWGGHYDCPGDVRKAQRPEIIRRAQALDGKPRYPLPDRFSSVTRQVITEIAWSPVDGTDFYQYQVVDADSGAVLVANQRVTSPSALVTTRPGGHANWRMAVPASADGSVRASPWSPWQSFTAPG